MAVFSRIDENIIDPITGLAIVKSSVPNQSGFGGPVFKHSISADNTSGTVVVSNSVSGNNSHLYNSSVIVLPNMALLFNSHGSVVTPNFGDAITNAETPFNFAGIALTSTEQLPPKWTEQFPSQSPGPRFAASMSFDSSSNRSTLFGGTNDPFASSLLGDTWEWDGKQWINHTSAHTPDARAFHISCYDTNRNRIVLFGGRGISGQLGDTWEWDTSDWTHISTVHSPTARSLANMVFDSVRNVCVLFGGFNDPTYYNDTWEYPHSADWQQITTAHSPGVRFGHAMGFDISRGVTVLFGGIHSITQFNDTWEYNGTDWTQIIIPGTNPPSRVWPAMVYDPLQKLMVLFGGIDFLTGNVFNDLWHYDGINWIQINGLLGPSPRALAAFDYDPNLNKMVLFGGIDQSLSSMKADTWHLGSSNVPVLVQTQGDGYVYWDAYGVFPIAAGGLRRASNVVTVKTLSPHTFIPGNVVNLQPGETNFTSGNKTIATVVDGYTFTYNESGSAVSSVNGELIKASGARVVPAVGDFLGPSSVNGTVTYTNDGFSPIFGYALEGPVVNALTSALYQTSINGQNVGLIKMRIEPFFGFIPPLSAPTIVNFTPGSGVVGTKVTINGTGFVGYNTLVFDGPPATSGASVNVISNDQITAVVPAGAHTGAITVTRTTSATSGSSFVVLPSITSLSRTTGFIHATVVITGHTFAGSNTHITSVTFNGVSAAFTIDNDAQITTSVPVGATTGPLLLTDSAGNTATYPEFVIIPPPTLSTISPLEGASGSLVTLTGTGFSAGNLFVQFVNFATTIAIGSDNVVLPQATINVVSTTGFPTSGDLIIFSSNGLQAVHYTGKTSNTFTGCTGGTGTIYLGYVAYYVTTAPLTGFITSVRDTTITAPSDGNTLPQSTINVVSTHGFPASGNILVTSSIGPQTVAYTGITTTSFTGCTGGLGTLSTGNDVALPVMSDTQVVVVVPTPISAQPSTPYQIVIATDGGTVTSSTTFTIVPLPLFLPVVTTTIAAGSDGASLPQSTIHVNSATSFSADGYLSVVTDNGTQDVAYTGKSSNTFTGCTGGTGTMHTGNNVKSATFFPSTGRAGSVVDIVGQYGFTGLQGVFFSGYQSPVTTFTDDQHISAVVPSIPDLTHTTVDIVVETVGGSQSTSFGFAAGSGPTNPQHFKIILQPSITSISPNKGASGNTVVITGHSFLTADRVFFTGKTSVSSSGNTARTGGNTVAVDTTPFNHNFTSGDTILIDSGDANFPSTFAVIVVDSATTFHYTQTGSNTTSTVDIHFFDTNAAATFTVVNDTQINAVIPPASSGIANGPITVSNGFNDPLFDASTSFTYLFAPTGTTTTVAAGSDGAALPQGTINVVSTTGYPTSGTISVESTAGTQTVHYTNTTPTSFTGCTGGTGTIHTGYTVIGAHIYVTPNAGGYGQPATIVTIYGSNLTNSDNSAPTVTFGGVPAVIDGYSSTVVTVTVPSGSSDGIRLTTDGGTDTQSFAVVPTPTIYPGINPTSGVTNQGPMLVTINGFNFTNSQTGGLSQTNVMFVRNSLPIAQQTVAPSTLSANSMKVDASQIDGLVLNLDTVFAVYVVVTYPQGQYVVLSPQTFEAFDNFF